MAGDGEKLNKKKRIIYKCSFTNTISEVLTNRNGWIQTMGDDWNLLWATREWMTSQFDKHKFTNNQFVCHFRNDFELTRKDFLIKNYKKYRKMMEKNVSELNFVPSSYVLPAEYHLFVEEFRKYANDSIWIMKPVAGAQGNGIFLFKKLSHIKEWKKKDSYGSDALPYVVQSYIHNPYLIGGKKFDLRLYVLVTSFRPLNAWVHKEGFARFSHSKYSNCSVDDAFVHLTNVAISKTASDYDPERGVKWSFQRLLRFFMASHPHTDVWRMMGQLSKVIINSLRSVENIIVQDSHCFELFGYDIIFDHHFKPWLLEVNASPSLTASSQEDLELKTRMLNDMLDVIDLENKRTGLEICVGGFDLLVKNGIILERPRSNMDGRSNEMFIMTTNIRIGEYIQINK